MLAHFAMLRERLHRGLHPLFTLIDTLRAQRRQPTALVAEAAALTLLITTGLLGWHALAGNAEAPAKNRPWRYLVVCAHCEQRTYTPEHPAHVSDTEGGQLVCPQCSNAAASWYRRGSLNLPPGGW